MIRKFTYCLALIFLSASWIKSQNTNTVVVVDTVNYYFNKQFHKFGPYYPYRVKTGTSDTHWIKPAYTLLPTSVQSSTRITHIGVRFETPQPIEVKGLGVYAYKPNLSHNVNSTPMRLYLCGVANNLPAWPPIDSVDTQFLNADKMMPSIKGGGFKSKKTNKDTSHIMTNGFAIMGKSLSNSEGDTIFVLRTDAKSSDNGTVSVNQKYSDGYGYVRYQNTIYNTKNFNLYANSGLGNGTDYEFALAPVVQYTATYGHSTPSQVTKSDTITDTLCVSDIIEFENHASSIYLHRQYNFLELARYWWPLGYKKNVTNDSSIVWTSEALLLSSGGKYDLYYLKRRSNGTSFTSFTNYEPGCFKNDLYKATIKKMTLYGAGALVEKGVAWKSCWKFCNGDEVGMTESSMDVFGIYPNPNNTGVLNIRGVDALENLVVTDITGRPVLQYSNLTDLKSVDLGKFAPGIYLIKANAKDGRTAIRQLIVE